MNCSPKLEPCSAFTHGMQQGQNYPISPTATTVAGCLCRAISWGHTGPQLSALGCRVIRWDHMVRLVPVIK